MTEEEQPMGSWAPLPNNSKSIEEEKAELSAASAPAAETLETPKKQTIAMALEEEDSKTVSTDEESATGGADHDEEEEEAEEDDSEQEEQHKTPNKKLFATPKNEIDSHVERQQVVVTDHRGFCGIYTGRLLLTTTTTSDDNDNEKELLIPDGHGTMVYDNHPSVASYTGHWKRGAWSGQGQSTLTNGDTYSGEHQQGTRHGSGTYRWKDGRKYAGMFWADARHGQGVYQWPDGAVFQGDYEHGVRTGYGKYLDPTEGISYTGDWKQGQYHGYGVLTCTITDDENENNDNNNCDSKSNTDLPKRVYRGNFFKGQAHGHGVEINPDGSVRHEGDWQHGEPLGADGKPLPIQEEERPQPELLVVQNQPNIRDANGMQGTYRGILHVATSLPHGNGTFTYDKFQTTPDLDDQLDYYEGCFDMGHYHGRGRLYWKNGDAYDGEYVNGKRHGTGTYTWSNGRNYKGEFQNDMRHGFGKFVYGKQNADWYEGEFVMGRREGKGRFVFADGSVYDGEWKEGVYQGQGTLVSVSNNDNSNKNKNNKTTYTGSFDRGLAHGQGKETNADGTVVYEGNWIHGDPEPEAKRKAEEAKQRLAQQQHLQHATAHPPRRDMESNTGKPQPECEAVVDVQVVDAEGNTGQYTGLVLYGTKKPHGVGRMVYLDGRRIHEGFWKNGMKDGHGRCLFVEQGDYHEGEYKNNVRHGPGTYKWSDGRVFSGHYLNDLRNGPGTFTYPSGEKYEGNFSNGEKHGHGMHAFAGGFYEGEFNQGRYHGRGRLSDQGKIWEGVFRHGGFVGEATCDVHRDEKGGPKADDNDVDSVNLEDEPTAAEEEAEDLEEPESAIN